MDKNIVALVREDTKTVTVRFFPDDWGRTDKFGNTAYSTNLSDLDTRALSTVNIKDYMYVTTLDFKAGDLAVVYIGCAPKVVEVQSVSTDLCIEPNDTKQYRWVVAKVDETYYQQLMEQNEELTDLIRKEYQERTRRNFREMFLADAPAALVDKLKGIQTK